jgi:hypothetical protein
VPDSALGKIATARIYAASPSTGRDAIGSVDFARRVAVSTPVSSLSAWWQRAMTPAPRKAVRTDDTIEMIGFDQDKSAGASKPVGEGAPPAGDSR